jgi:hypothetical protein
MPDFGRCRNRSRVLLQNPATEQERCGHGISPNTVRRAGIFHFRRAVPAVLRAAFKCAELTCSMRTSDVAAARSLSRGLYIRSEDLFGAVRCAPLLSEQDIAAKVRHYYRTILAQDDSSRLMCDTPLPDAWRAARIEQYEQLAERLRIDLASNAFGSVRQITSTMLAQRFGSRPASTSWISEGHSRRCSARGLIWPRAERPLSGGRCG